MDAPTLLQPAVVTPGVWWARCVRFCPSLASAEGAYRLPVSLGWKGQKRAKPAVNNRSKADNLLIMSSARASKASENSRPSTLAALKLMASPYFVRACTCESAGFPAPDDAIDIRS